MARYTSSLDLRDMIADRDIISLAEACNGNMWTMLRMTRILPYCLPESEIDDFLIAVEKSVKALQ